MFQIPCQIFVNKYKWKIHNIWVIQREIDYARTDQISSIETQNIGLNMSFEMLYDRNFNQNGWFNVALRRRNHAEKICGIDRTL